MNLCFALTYPPIPNIGGVERVTFKLIKEFENLGYLVFCICLNAAERECNSDIGSNFNITYFPSNDIANKENVVFYQCFLKKHQIDIVINQQGLYKESFLFLETPPNIKTISVIHSAPLSYYNNIWRLLSELKDNSSKEYFKRIIRCLLFFKVKVQSLRHFQKQYQFIGIRSDAIVTLSKKYSDELKNFIPSLTGKLYHISNPNSFSTTSYTLTDKQKIVLYVGRLHRDKRIDRLLKIWKEIEKNQIDWVLKIVGTGEEESKLKNLSKALALKHVLFEGRKDSKPYYKEASIICLTSNFEGFPMVITEAMQFGCVPIVFNTFSASSDIITNHKNGIIIPPFNKRLFCKQLLNIMEDCQVRNTMAYEASKRVESYDIKVIAQNWNELFNKLHKK